MATPARQGIIENIGTVLTGITRDNGYKTNVFMVEPVYKTYADVPENHRPFVCHFPFESSTIEHQMVGSMRVTMPYLIIGHVSATSKTLVVEKLNDLLDDIIAVLYTDETRGGNAVMTLFMDHQDDIGNPDTIGTNSWSGTLEMMFNIIYYRTIGSS